MTPAARAQSKPRRHHSSRVHSRQQLQLHLRAIQRKKRRLRVQLHETRQRAKAVLTDLHAVDDRLDSVRANLADTQDQLASDRVKQRELAGSLTDATVRLRATRTQVAARLRRIYMRQDSGLVSALVGTTGFGELASRKFLLETIARHDHSLFTEYAQLQREIRDQKSAQDSVVRRIAGLEARERSQASRLSEVRNEKGELLQNLRSQAGEMQRMLNQFEADEQEISAQVAAFRSRAEAHGGARLPVFRGRFSAPIRARMTSTFGQRYHPILHRVRMHYGVDFGAPVGTTIMAAADGVVISTSYMRGYGNVVLVDHGGGVTTVYAHTSRFYVSPGMHVQRGQRIAAVGMTGLSTGPHLHFEVHIGGHAVNPIGRL